jgi:uncharacterized repeat protein (TIGR01451 family)
MPRSTPSSSGCFARRLRLTFIAALLAVTAALALPAFAQQADLVVNQSDSPDPGPAGGIFTYTVRVDNNGPNTASAVALTNTLPGGAVFVSVTQTQGTCAQAAGVVTCALGSIAFSASATVTIKVKLPVAGVYTNTATATSPETDPDPSNNVNITETTTAQIAADMSITAVDAPDPVSAGQPYQYTVTATNNGPNALGPTDTQTIVFNVPAGACITSAPTGGGWACVPAGGYPQCSTATTITCTRTGSLAVGASAPTLLVNAVANQAGAVTESFFVSSSLPDGDPTNNTDTPSTTVVGGSDVSITKAASPAIVAVGSNVTYTLTPRLNGGEQPGSSGSGIITVTDTLGANLTFVSANGSGWTCTFAAPVVTCTRPGPYTGGNFTNMPTITIVATATATGTLSNTATIAIPETDPVPGNNTASINVNASNDADLSMSKSASLNPVVPNVPFNYSLTVRNNGPLAVAATNTITATDTLPAGITLTGTPTGSGWTCTPNSGFPLAGPVAVSCTRPGPLAVNANAPAITVPVIATTTGPLVNNACAALSGAGPVDSNAANDCASVSISSTVLKADLQATSKTANPDPVLAGQPLTYVISVINNGPDPATNVVVTDALASLVNIGGLQSATPSPGGTCLPSAPANGVTQNLSCNLGTLGVGATATVTVVILPSIAVSGPRTNTARVASLDVGDPNPNNNSASVTSQVTAVADVTVQKSANPSPVQAGTPLTFVITARNNGPSTAQTVVTTDTMPGNAVLTQLPVVTGGGGCVSPPLGTTGGTITCTWAAIAAATQFTATYVVRPLTSAAGGTVVNSVAITTTTLESNAANNTATTTTPVTPAQIDMLVNKTDSVDPVVLGQTTTYTVTVTNAGPSFANNVTMVDTFPLGGTATATFSYQGSLTINPPAIGTCTEPAIGATSGTLNCAVPGLANGQSAIITYVMRAESIASGVSGTTYNTATVSATEPETQPANNSTTQATTTRKTADLAITKSAPASATPGTTFNYVLLVTNNGPNPSVGAVVTDTLPAGLVFQSASPGCVFVSPKVTCTLGTLVNGASTTLTIGVRVSSPFTGTLPIVNTASVATVNEVDPVSPNNSSSASTVLDASVADLALVKTAPSVVRPGALLVYTLKLTNNGPSASVGAIVTDPLPPGLTFVSASAGCTYGAGTVTCVAGTLASGSSTTFTITTKADSPFMATNPVSNSATVTATNEVDPNPGNNTGTAVTRVMDEVPVPATGRPLLLLLALVLTGLAMRTLRRR